MDFWDSKILLSDVFNAVPRPGLSHLKKVQPCTNRRRFVPPKFKDEMHPKYPDLLIEKVKIQRKEKNKVKKYNKKTHDGNLSNEESVLTNAKNIMQK